MQKYSPICLLFVLMAVTHIALSVPIDLAAPIVKEWKILHIANLADFPWDKTATSRAIILNEDGTDEDGRVMRNVRDLALRTDRPGGEHWGVAGGFGPGRADLEGAWDRKRPFRFARYHNAPDSSNTL